MTDENAQTTGDQADPLAESASGTQPLVQTAAESLEIAPVDSSVVIRSPLVAPAVPVQSTSEQLKETVDRTVRVIGILFEEIRNSKVVNGVPSDLLGAINVAEKGIRESFAWLKKNV